MGALGGIVLAGGAARRLSGADKPMLEVGGSPLLRRAVDALADADDVVVVGPQRPGFPEVRWTVEEPPGSGPASALAAGLAVLQSGCAEVAVLAGDLVGVTAATVLALREAVGDADGAVLLDEAGARQWLIGVWRTDALRAAMPADPTGSSVRAIFGQLSIVDVPAGEGEADDVDTEADLRRARGDLG